MATNIAFVDGHPVIRPGADEGELAIVGGRVRVSSSAHRAAYFTLERSIDGGTTWEAVLAEVITGEGANLVDYESLSYGSTLYRAVAFTVEGATAETTVTVDARSMALWLSGGAAFAQTARLPLNPAVEHTVSRERALKEYAGREKPVAYAGEHVTRTVAVSGLVEDRHFMDDTASPDTLAELAQNPEPVFLFRDPDGRRIYGTIGAVNLPRQLTTSDGDPVRPWNGLWGYSFTITETDKEA